MQLTSEKCLSVECISKPRTLFDKLDFFGIKYISEKNFFEKSALLDFESIFVKNETFRDTSTLTWIGKHVQITPFLSSNRVGEPIFPCNSDPYYLVATLIGALGNFDSQSKAKTKSLFHDIETIIKIKLVSILEKHTQCLHRPEEVRRFDMNQDIRENENCVSTQFLQIQKNQLIGLQLFMER